MAEESRAGRQGGKRRRYFRRKGGDKPQSENEARAEQGAARPERPERAPKSSRSGDRSGGRAARAKPGHEPGSLIERHGSAPSGAAAGRTSLRRRRRSKNRRGDTRSDQPIIPAAPEPDYEPPTSVFIYTHTARPAAQGYEFRAEHFSKVGRTLDDYDIDLSSLFDAEGRIQLSRIAPGAFANLDFDDEDESPSPAQPASAAGLGQPPALEQADVGEADDSRFDDSRDLPTRDLDGAPDLPPVYGADDTLPPGDEPGGPSVAVSE